MKKILVKATAYFFFSAIMLSAFILLLEIVFRFMPVYNREWMDYDSVTVWRIKKNNTSKKWTYDYPEFMQHINREGFNDINHDFEKEAGSKKNNDNR